MLIHQNFETSDTKDAGSSKFGRKQTVQYEINIIDKKLSKIEIKPNMKPSWPYNRKQHSTEQQDLVSCSFKCRLSLLISLKVLERLIKSKNIQIANKSSSSKKPQPIFSSPSPRTQKYQKELTKINPSYNLKHNYNLSCSIN